MSDASVYACLVLFKNVFLLKMHQNIFFSDLFFIFDVNTSKSLENTKKKHQFDDFSRQTYF
jgi:hypothetical protein